MIKWLLISKTNFPLNKQPLNINLLPIILTSKPYKYFVLKLIKSMTSKLSESNSTRIHLLAVESPRHINGPSPRASSFKPPERAGEFSSIVSLEFLFLFYQYQMIQKSRLVLFIQNIKRWNLEPAVDEDFCLKGEDQNRELGFGGKPQIFRQVMRWTQNLDMVFGSGPWFDGRLPQKHVYLGLQMSTSYTQNCFNRLIDCWVE